MFCCKTTDYISLQIRAIPNASVWFQCNIRNTVLVSGTVSDKCNTSHFSRKRKEKGRVCTFCTSRCIFVCNHISNELPIQKVCESILTFFISWSLKTVSSLHVFLILPEQITKYNVHNKDRLPNGLFHKKILRKRP